ncbi:MAG: hypothetical protein WD651_01365 [Acidimicrobiia bacterium]
MIVRLPHSRYGVGLPSPTWPAEPSDTATHLFAGRTPFRKVRVMVDADLLEKPEPPKPPTKKHLLSDLLEIGLVELFRYADNGPRPEVSPMVKTDSFISDPAYEG